MNKIHITPIRYALDMPKNPLPFPTLSMRANHALYLIGIDTYEQGKLLMEKIAGTDYKLYMVGKVTHKELTEYFV